MNKTRSILLVTIGLLNLYPVIGVISAEQLNVLYGISIDSPDLEILMRHRAVMLGLIGAFLLFAAVRSSLQMIAALVGFVSMSSFVILGYLSDEIGAEVNRVIVADIVGSALAAVVLIIIVKARRGAA